MMNGQDRVRRRIDACFIWKQGRTIITATWNDREGDGCWVGRKPGSIFFLRGRFMKTDRRGPLPPGPPRTAATPGASFAGDGVVTTNQRRRQACGKSFHENVSYRSYFGLKPHAFNLPGETRFMRKEIRRVKYAPFVGLTTNHPIKAIRSGFHQRSGDMRRRPQLHDEQAARTPGVCGCVFFVGWVGGGFEVYVRDKLTSATMRVDLRATNLATTRKPNRDSDCGTTRSTFAMSDTLVGNDVLAFDRAH